MNKELFIETMIAIKKQQEHDMKCSEAFGIILPNDFVSNYNNTYLYNQIIRLLEVLMKDDGGWISWFIYETDFGSKKMGAYYPDNSPINLSDSGKLYEFLTNQTHKQ